MEEVQKGCLMIRMGVSGWMFLLVPAHLGSPGQRAVKQLCVCVCVTSLHKFDQTTSTSHTGFVTFSTDWRHYTLCWPSQDRSWRPAAVVHRCGPSACSCRRTHWDRWRAATVQCGHNPTARTANPDHCQRINTETVKLRQKTKQRWPFPAKYTGWSDITESMVTIRSPFCWWNTI